MQNRGCVAKQLNGKAATESFGAACDGLLIMFVRHLFPVNMLKNIHNTPRRGGTRESGKQLTVQGQINVI